MNCAQKNSRFPSLRQVVSHLVVLPLAVFVTNVIAGETPPPVSVDEPGSFGLMSGLIAVGLVVRWAVRRRGRKSIGTN